MAALPSGLRGVLERSIILARDAAEESSATALRALGVDVDRVAEHLPEEGRRLRVALRTEARQLGGFERLVEECAYAQWHRMLFARFLAENQLLIHPGHGVAVSLVECEEIARDRDVGDPWVVAAEFASEMLPGIFRSNDPVLQVRLAPEGQRALEELLAGLPRDVFVSDDGLGWVYQYWQAKRKKEVNDSGRKIGGVDIAPVTQLFTEHYIVRFLLENSLGAWWAAREPGSPLMKEWDYLRFDEAGIPAAGVFPGWPDKVADVTVMDPCCGSGHFLVTAFEMLRRMRMEAEGLSAAQAGDAVLRDNLFGLELDARCTQIAAFALALQAWKMGGYRQLPVPNIACAGISAAGRLDDWKRLAKGDERLDRSLERLHSLFADAADLGSLIDPLRETDGGLLAARFEEVASLLHRALGRESAGDPSAAVFGNSAAGAARAGALLGRRYTLVSTNPPFLGRGKQEENLRTFLEREFPESRQDLATAFLDRAREFTIDQGHLAMVTPENWFVQASYAALRSRFLESQSLNFCAILGEEGFQSFGIRGPRTVLLVIENARPNAETAARILDVSTPPGREQILIPEKITRLRNDDIPSFQQSRHAKNPGKRILFSEQLDSEKLGRFATSHQGLKTGDDSRLRFFFWELDEVSSVWEYAQGGPLVQGQAGLHYIVALGDERASIARLQGLGAWSKRGVAVLLTRHMTVAPYFGVPFFSEIAAVTPHDPAGLSALIAFAQSGELQRRVREIDRGTIISNATILDIPFDPSEWSASAVPSDARPEASHPVQWRFSGHPRGSDMPLMVAVARLVAYQWPRQRGQAFPDCAALGPDGLEKFADEDGIVCIPSVRGERPAAERLRSLLAEAFGDEWSPGREADLLGEVGYREKSLEQWLRDGSFEQHCQVFGQRPFVWQIWDGRKDGFSALVNYNRLDRPTLERLTYSYLGDWIRQQRSGLESGVAGSEVRLVAAEELQRKLRLILDGEAPHDVFVRWKPINEQPLGWEPDLNDGVRVNIRPFVTAGVLRKNPRVNWNKDRGKDRENAPWYHLFKGTDREGERINDHHLTLAEKQAAREASAALAT